MQRYLRKKIGHFVDALAWCSMHAIARRQERRNGARCTTISQPISCDLTLLFPAPAVENVRITPLTEWRKRGRIWRRDSTFASALPSLHDTNNTVYVRTFAPACRVDLPAVIVLHGLMNITTAAYQPFLNAIVAAGACAHILELPYHHRRTPSGSFSGDLFHTVDLALTKHAVQQAVSDVRVLLHLLRVAGAAVTGVLGFSLGAWIGGLVACCEPQLRFALLGMPPSHLNELVWSSKLGVQLRRHFMAKAWSPASTAEFYAAVDPFSYRPLLAPERLQLYAAEFDTLIALEHVRALQKAWGMPLLRTYPHGHLTLMLSKQLHRDFRKDLGRQLTQ